MQQEGMMTHYDIDYSTMSEPQKSTEALQDIINYLGVPRFQDLTQLFRREYPASPDIERFTFQCAFAGVQGYPVLVWYEHIWGVKPHIEEEGGVT